MCCWNFVAKLVKNVHPCAMLHLASTRWNTIRWWIFWLHAVSSRLCRGCLATKSGMCFFSFIVFTWVFGMSNLPTCYCWGLGWWHYAWRLCAGTHSPKGVSLVGGTTMFHMDLSSSWQYRSYLYKAKRCLTNLSIVPLWDAVGVLSCMIIYLYDMYLCWCWFTVWLSMTVWMILCV